MENKHNGHKKRFPWGKLVAMLALTALALVLLFGWRLYDIYEKGRENLSNTGHETPPPEEAEVSPSEMVDILEDDLDVSEDLPEGYTNILLLGSDTRNGKSYGRSDAMLIASVNNKTGEVKLTSIMRDIWVDIPRKGKNKINAAMAYGGPALAMKTVNQAFDMNISTYIFVDFVGFPYIINKLGGINLDIEKSELKYLNETIGDLNKSNYPKNTDFSLLKEYGKNTHLTGIQALAYARIRHADSDFVRTQRQRNVLMAIFKKIKSQGFSLGLAESAAALLPSVETNLSLKELLKTGGTILASDLDTLKELRIPIDGSFSSVNYGGAAAIKIDFKENTKALHDFIYED